MADAQLIVFVSYSRADSEFVDRLDADLRARGFSVWVDRHRLEGGQLWAEKIDAAIADCDLFLLVLSKTAVDSPYVRHEVEEAERLDKRFLPIVFEACVIPPWLTSVWGKWQGQDFTDTSPIAYALNVKRLLYAIQYPTLNLSAPTAQLHNLALQLRATDPERAAILLQHIIDREPAYFGGQAQRDLADLERDLYTTRVTRLRAQALQAHQKGEYGVEAASLEALLALGDHDADAYSWAKEYLPIAQQNRAMLGPYGVIQYRIADNDLAIARTLLQNLWNQAPYFCDPANIAATLELVVPPSYQEVKKKRLDEEARARIEQALAEQKRLEDEARVRAERVRAEQKRRDDEARVRAEQKQLRAREACERERRLAAETRARAEREAAKQRDEARASAKNLHKAKLRALESRRPKGSYTDYCERTESYQAKQSSLNVIHPMGLSTDYSKSIAPLSNVAAKGSGNAAPVIANDSVPHLDDLERQFLETKRKYQQMRKRVEQPDTFDLTELLERMMVVFLIIGIIIGGVIGFVYAQDAASEPATVYPIVGYIGFPLLGMFAGLVCGPVLGWVLGLIVLSPISGILLRVQAARNRELADNFLPEVVKAYKRWQQAYEEELPKVVKLWEDEQDRALQATKEEYENRMATISSEHARTLADIEARCGQLQVPTSHP